MHYLITGMFEDTNNEPSKVGGISSKIINLKSTNISPLDRLKRPVSPSKILASNTPDSSLKKQKFEAFLSYRKYLSRLALSQGLHFYETLNIIKDEEFTIEKEVNEIYRVIIYFYKKVFFQDKYGDNKKNKKLDEQFIRISILKFLKNKELIDSYIKNHINKKWCLNKLHSVIKSSLRAAICEAIYAKKVSHKIIVNEYTDIVANSVASKKEVDFFNAVLDSILKQINIDYADK